MDRLEAKKLLIQASAIDNRVVSEPAVLAWQQALADVAYEDACTALVEFRRSSAAYLQPAHLLGIIRGWNDELARIEADELEAKRRWLAAAGLSLEQFESAVAANGLTRAVADVESRLSLEGGDR